MNLVQRIFRNSLWLFSAQAGGRLAGVLITMALTRTLGIQDFGRYSLIYAFCGIFGVMTDIGIDTIVVREASRQPDRAGNLLGNGMLLKAAFSLLAILAAGCLAKLLGISGESVGLILLASLSFLASPLTLYNAMFQATLRLRYPALFNLAGRALALLFVLLAVAFHGSLTCIVLSMLAATFAQALFTAWFSRRFFRLSFRIDTRLLGKLLSDSWPLALNNLLLVLVLRVDQIMIQRLSPDGEFELGLYSAAVRYAELFHFLPAVFFASIFPLLSRLTPREEDAFRRLYTLSLNYLTLIITPVVLFSAYNAPRIMSLLFGEEFSGSARAMEILIGSEVFVFLTWVVVNTAVSSGQQRVVPVLTLACLAANIALNLILIPGRGAEGAALASLISYGLVLPLCAAARGLRPLVLAFLRIAVRPAVGAGLLWVLLPQLPAGLVLSGFAVFAGFPVLMVLFGALGQADLLLVRRALARGKE
jgi:O-antigen/teichoic acid export membrane protein